MAKRIFIIKVENEEVLWYNQDIKQNGGRVMADSPLIAKSKEFALQIIKVCNYVKQNKKESVI